MTDTMTIREMCDTFQVTPRTLRFYEQKELLAPLRQGTRRLYTRRDRARLTLILRGRQFGFSLEAMRQLLDLYDRDGGDAAQIARAADLDRTRLAEMEQQRAALDRTMAELREQLAWAEQALAAHRTDAA
ncbi:MAG: MerR family DNA-binding transcriptional regulator [Rhodobacterales bacterium]|nr:MerR family DNA-binding transcriptional regulator [Rhodobacterales bacterium]